MALFAEGTEIRPVVEAAAVRKLDNVIHFRGPIAVDLAFVVVAAEDSGPYIPPLDKQQHFLEALFAAPSSPTPGEKYLALTAMPAIGFFPHREIIPRQLAGTSFCSHAKGL
jgi:hypothetical protein